MSSTSPQGHWHRWQLTAPLAALSRPVRTRPTPQAPRTTSTGSSSATGTTEPTTNVAGPSAAGGDVATGGPATAAPGAAGTQAADGLPVLLGGARARQVDGTTCGSAVLVMLAATGDPALAEWLETGRLPDGARPPEVPDDVDGLDAAGRFAAAQRHVMAATARRAIGPLPWPAALGTPPWTAAREARFPGVRYRVRPLDDAAADAATLLGLVVAATHRGHPVPLYAGGDLRGGVSHAVPRHVVLAVPPPPGAATPGVLQVYEPSVGSVYSVPVTELLGRTTSHPALGGWTHVTAALLPVPAPDRR